MARHSKGNTFHPSAQPPQLRQLQGVLPQRANRLGEYRVIKVEHNFLTPILRRNFLFSTLTPDSFRHECEW